MAFSTFANGFLTTWEPLQHLPASHHELEHIVSRLPQLLHNDDPDALRAAVAALPLLPLPEAVLVMELRAPAPNEEGLSALAALSQSEADSPNAPLVHALFRVGARTAQRGKAGRARAALTPHPHPPFSPPPLQDYAILASAYMLQPGQRGEPVRAELPPQLAVPLWRLSSALGLPPILEYTSYCLGNIARLPPPPQGAPAATAAASAAAAAPWQWQELRLIRKMDGGPEESTFVLIHAEIEAHTKSLCAAFSGVLCALAAPPAPHPPGAAGVLLLAAALDGVHAVVRAILLAQLKMFNACDPAGYVRHVRPWIFGARGNPAFPPGGAITFRGVDAEAAAAPGARKWVLAASPPGGEPWVTASLRGETGAQSSIIPALDALLGVRHGHDSLRLMLAELEHYRPPAHRALLRALRRALWGAADGCPEDVAVADALRRRGLSAPPPPGLAAAAAAGGCPGGGGGGGGGDAAAAAGAACPATGAMPPPPPPPPPPAPHALRDTVAASGDRALVRAYNRCVADVFCFRECHLAYAELYIARFTAREHATGGTPYRAYLSKHTAESSPAAAQVLDGPGGAEDGVFFPTPAPEAFAAQVDACLAPGGSGIPLYLRERFAADIAAAGAACPGLGEKVFPREAP
jgi:hypothetical protein